MPSLQPNRKDPWAERVLRLESLRVSRTRPTTPPRLPSPSYLGAAARAGGRLQGGRRAKLMPASLRGRRGRRGGGAAAPGSGQGQGGRRGRRLRLWRVGCAPPSAPPRPARAACRRPAPAVFFRAAGHALPPGLGQRTPAAPSGHPRYPGSAPPPFPEPQIPISHRLSASKS